MKKEEKGKKKRTYLYKWNKEEKMKKKRERKEEAYVLYVRIYLGRRRGGAHSI